MIRAIVQDDLIIGYRDSKGKLYRLSYEDFIESENELAALDVKPYTYLPDNYSPIDFILDK